MQPNRAGRKLGRTTAHRKSLFRNQLSSLITHERIQTTLPKAKDLRPLIEKMVTLGKRGGLHARRLVLKTIPEATTVKKLFEEAKKLVSGKGDGDKSDKAEKKGEGAEAEGETEKKAKPPVEKKKGYTAPKGPKGSGPRGGGTHGGS